MWFVCRSNRSVCAERRLNNCYLFKLFSSALSIIFSSFIFDLVVYSEKLRKSCKCCPVVLTAILGLKRSKNR